MGVPAAKAQDCADSIEAEIDYLEGIDPIDMYGDTLSSLSRSCARLFELISNNRHKMSKED